MLRAINIVATLGGAALFWYVVPLLRLFDAFQPMVVVMSVLIAAVFVRLNRGMPSLEWKNLEAKKRSALTAKIVELSRDYVWIVSLNGLTLLALVTMTIIGRQEISTLWPIWVQSALSATVGALFVLSLARVGYVVWRDCEIMELQKALIDMAADAEVQVVETNSAETKLSSIKAAGLRKIEVSPTEPL